MADFNSIFESLKDKVKDLAELTVCAYKKAAVKDAETFLQESRRDLERWTSLLAQGKLSTEDFEWLVEGLKDLAHMELLKQTALAKIRVDKFRDALLNLVVDTIFGAVKP